MKPKQPKQSTFSPSSQSPTSAAASSAPTPFSNLPIWALFGFAFLLYAYTITFGYVLDDQLYIISNTFTKQGFAGIPSILSTESLVGFFGEQKDLLVGSRYRPLAIVTYAIEYGLWGEKPGISHFINLILYALTSVIIYRLFCKLMPPSASQKWYLTLPFITAALFIAHPIHTEVIANIKGRLEILDLLLSLVTLNLCLQYLRTEKTSTLTLIFVTFFAALMAKESAITFLGVVPLTLYIFTSAQAQHYIKPLAAMLGATALFLFVRYLAIGQVLGSGNEITELLNNPFIGASTSDKYATIFYTLGLYLKLLIFPLTLTHDYYPKQIPIIGWSDMRALLSLFAYIILAGIAVWGVMRKNIWGYAAAFYLFTLSIVSNLVFPIGTFMNERFVYVPSIAFCLVVAYFLVEILYQKRHLLNATTLAFASFTLLGLYSARTFFRVPAWQNNETLFLTDVVHSPNSTKVLTAAGGTLVDKGASMQNNTEKIKTINEGIPYLERALAIYPDNTNALLLLGNAYLELDRNYEKAFPNYYHLLTLEAQTQQIYRNLALMSDTEDNPQKVDQLINFLEQKVLPLNPQTTIPYDALGTLYGRRKNNLDKALEYYSRATTFKDVDAGTYQDMGIVYGMRKDYPKALEMNQKALELVKDTPTKAKIYMNLGITAQEMGDADKAKRYFEQAFALDPKLNGK